jgi:hypothetical protein
VVTAVKEQARCGGAETAIGQLAYDNATDAVRTMFGNVRKRSGLDYDTAISEMSSKNDKTARAAKAAGLS